MVAAPIKMADWARGASDSIRMAQSVPSSFEYTEPVFTKAKLLRGPSSALASVATVALHALLVGWVIHAGSPQKPLPAPSPIRIELLRNPAARLDPVAAVPPPVTLPLKSGAEVKGFKEQPTLPATASAVGSVRASSLANTALPPIAPDAPPATSPDPVAAIEADEFSPQSSSANDPDPADGYADRPPAAAGTPVEQVDDQAKQRATDTIEHTDQNRPTQPSSTGTSIAERVDPAADQRRVPPSIQGRWRYQVFYGDYVANNLVATLDYVLNIHGERYRLHTEGHAVGLLALFYRGFFTQVSEGAFNAKGFRSERFEERRGDRPPRVVRMENAHSTRVVRFEDGRSEMTSALAQDRLSLAAQLAWVAAQQSDGLHEQEVTIPLVGASSVRLLRFQVARAQILELAGGVQRLTRLRSEDGDGERPGSVEIWLSESGDLMPIRIRLEDRNGHVLDQLIGSN